MKKKALIINNTELNRKKLIQNWRHIYILKKI